MENNFLHFVILLNFNVGTTNQVEDKGKKVGIKHTDLDLKLRILNQFSFIKSKR